jgi:predicted Rossmann fold flavoprotein
MQSFDVAVIGAGAAGMLCAAMAGQLGCKVLLLDHATRIAEKIRISGGGRCNFTNRESGPANFLSDNPHFCRSALALYTPRDFIALMQRHRIAWHEKHKGQLFCDDSSEQIIRMLLDECRQGGVTHWQPCTVHAVRRHDARYELDSDLGTLGARRLVIATGGLSIPKIGASDFGYRIARQFGHGIVPTRPGLVPLTFDAAPWAPFSALSGLALEARVESGDGEFVEDLLFTHRGLSGPAILQVSNHWHSGEPIHVDLCPGHDLEAALLRAKSHSRRHLANELSAYVPARLAETWLRNDGALAATTMPQLRDRDLRRLAASLHRWSIVPSGSEGYRKAEVTAGGVDTRELSSQTMQSERCARLYFIGEVVDVTGWLGGYNFQWAWASAAACARAIAAT